MFKSLRELFAAGLVEADQPGSQTPEQGLYLATSVLLVEMVRADHQIDEREQAAVIDAISAVFSLDISQAQEIMALAEAEADAATSLHQFTSQLNDHFTPERKVEVIELLWRVAMSDSVVEKYEEHLVRKVADLLYVPHRDFIRARHRAETDSTRDS